MKISELTESIQNYDNWVRYTPDSLQSDWSEYVHKSDTKWRKRAHMIGARWPLFATMADFKSALDRAPKVLIDQLDQTVNNLTINDDLEDIKSMVSSYAHPRDVDRIVQGLNSGALLPLPIILKGRHGLWIMAGNTRQAVSRVLGYEPEALLVDVSD